MLHNKLTNSVVPKRLSAVETLQVLEALQPEFDLFVQEEWTQFRL